MPIRAYILKFVRAGCLPALLFSYGAASHAQTFIMADGASWSSCSGHFYDSGGPAGGYANGEDMTVTLCPAGGPGSSPATWVYFVSFNAAATTDMLVIHDGTSTLGPVLATGDLLNDLTALDFQATDPSGCLTFHWTSDPAITGAGWNAEIITGPNAGTNASLTICSSETAFDMTGQLGGLPDGGGGWTAPGGAPHSEIYDPGGDPGGLYTYTVGGTGSCPDSSATLNITRVMAPDAGLNGTLAICGTDPPASLFDALGGTPDLGGNWSGPSPVIGGMYDPAAMSSGVYTYTVIGTPPCINASATVTVTENDPPDAGSNGSISVCSDDAPFNLITVLGGTPDLGGAWTLSGSPVSGLFDPATGISGTYVYAVNGIPPCPNDQANAVVNVTAAPDAGINTTLEACSDDAPFNMVIALDGTPDSGGNWSGPSPVIGDQFDPATMSGGTYTYTVSGMAPCGNASATLGITLQQAPDAGGDASITVCSIDATFNLIGRLGGTPDPGGSWTGPGGSASNGSFDPGVSPVGTYTYTVTGQPPCTNAVATVQVAVVNAPNAGANANTTVCSDASDVNMLLLLGGAPGGSWTGPDGPHPGNLFDPGVHTPGTYTYTVAGTPPCANASATVNVTVIQAPNAGTNGSITVCSTDGSFDLFALLGGNPGGGGTWTGPDPVVSGLYDPATMDEGVYTYVVNGTFPCSSDQATVTVTENEAPDAGSNGSVVLCSNDPPDTLFAHLGGTPDPGGAWTRPGGTAFGGVYNPANVNHPAGTYTYTVTGLAPCANATATVLVSETQAPNAGNNATVTKCSTQAPFNLLGLITGNPNPTGFWLDPNGVPFTNPFVPGTSPPGIYTYIVAGVAPCENDSSTVTVNVNLAPDAGSNGTLSICSSDAAVALIDSLNGTPDGTGVWSGPSPAPAGMYDPATMAPGVYTYTVDGAPPCADATATVTVTENPEPDAGGNAMIDVCSDDVPFSLFDLLSGSPDAGGTWNGPSPTTGTFDPATMNGGVYVYSVAGLPPCANDQATVSVFNNAAPYAGGDGDITICEDAGTIDLFTGLVGNYDPLGTWTDDDGTGQQSGSSFDPTGIAPGMYQFTYHVDDGGGPCGADEAIVMVEIVTQLDAGTNGTISACGNNDEVDLFSALGGGPQTGGVWIPLDGGTVTGSDFDATTVAAPGSYDFKYLITGSIGCAADSAVATVNVVVAPYAGENTTLTVCGNSTSPVNMLTLLGGQPGGTWSGPSLTAGNYIASSMNPGTYTYTRTGTPPCATDLATVVVTEVPAPNAGTSTSIELCITEPSIDMTDALLGTPSANGTWYNPSLQAHNATFTPGFDPPGVWTYVVPGTAPCPNDESTLTIDVVNEPDPGGPAQITVCSDGNAVILFDELTGSPGSGGSWTGPGGPHNGVYQPSIDSSGIYTYTVNDGPPCGSTSTTVEVIEREEADAGSSSSITLCANGANINLFLQLGGTPDATGYWTFPGCGGAPHSGIFDPGTSLPGSYCYHVDGILPCTDRTATVSVSVNAPPDAGCGNSIITCSDQLAFALIDSLLCTPDLSGDWFFGGLPHSGIFNPLTSTPGCYTYVVEGDVGCANASSTICVVVNDAPFAGLDNAIELCSTSGQVDLFQALGGSPDPGGTWSNINGPHSSTFQPGIDPEGVYTYTVNGQAPCEDDQATVNVQVGEEANAGCNGVVIVCDSDAPVILVNSIGCAPELNGEWSIGGAPFSGIYDPGDDTPGTYLYVVEADAPCPNDTASITVIENPAPDAGGSNIVSVCSDGPDFLLIDHLLGAPDGGGSWTDPDGDPFPSGEYDPGVSLSGIYTYSVVGQSPCSTDVATVNVQESTAPDAGISSAAIFCSDDPVVDLIDLLFGTPDPGGVWTTIGGDPHSGVFDPATDASGVFLYTVDGDPPCSDAGATVQVTVVPAVSAGGDGDLVACVDATGIDLFDGLTGGFNGGGTWTNDDGQGSLNGSLWDATGVMPGSYTFTYAVNGTPPCSGSSATVTVTIASALDAGEDTTIQACDSEVEVCLFGLIGGTPQPGGYWADLDGTNELDGNGCFNPSEAGLGSFEFAYILPASSGCLRDSSILTVDVLDGPNAGSDGAQTVCTNTGSFNLGVPAGGDGGGQWLDPSMQVMSPPLFVPASVPAGSYVYTYVVPGVGNCPGDSAQLTITVNPSPDAGGGASLDICDNDDPVLLFDLLTGTPDAGGSWIFGPAPGIPTDNIYNPAVDGPGTYTYVVAGLLGCSDAEAIITVTESSAPFAGLNNSIPVCSSQAPFQLFSYLGGVPGNGGDWSDPLGAPFGTQYVQFDPATDPGGPYDYVIEGSGACENDTATLTINLTIAPDAGADTTLPACITEACVDLFAGLGGTPDSSGAWQDLDGTSALFDSCFNATLVAEGSYQFEYEVIAGGNCFNDSAVVTVVVGAGASAGADSSVTICGGITTYDLFGSLGGTPDAGGGWTDPSATGALVDTAAGILDASLLPIGQPIAFVYTIIDPMCGDISAQVVVTATAYPDPGADSTLVLCATDAPLQLISALQGDPDAGGDWIDPIGNSHGGVFDPAASMPGAYTYQVSGIAPCNDTSAVVTVVVNQPPDAGEDGTLAVCDTLDALDLFTGLAGTPDASGTWTDLDGSGASSGGVLSTIGLEAGAYAHLYTVAVQACGSDEATVTVNVADGVDVSDTVLICNDQYHTYTISFLISGGDPSSYTVSGVAGTIHDSLPGVYWFESAAIVHSQSPVIVVDDQNGCGPRILVVLSPCAFDEEVFIPESFSPNGDLINDLLVIPGIEGFPQNTLVIFNRWGDRVFSADGYDNATKAWDGTSENALIPGDLPTGTYYYVLDLGDGSEAYKGFIYLNR